MEENYKHIKKILFSILEIKKFQLYDLKFLSI